MNTAIRVADANSSRALVVLTDRTQGGSSLADGAVELMVHRRLTADDFKGVVESLNEPGLTGSGLVVRGTHTLLLGPAGAPMAQRHRAALQTALLPLVWKGAPLPAGATPAAWAAGLPQVPASALAAALPPHVFLVTLHASNSTVTL